MNKYRIFILMLLVTFLVGCTVSSKKTATSASTAKTKMGKPALKKSITINNNKVSSEEIMNHNNGLVPPGAEALEAQIIRELRSAGCLIEQFEMNRRKQSMRISCAKEKQTGDFDI